MTLDRLKHIIFGHPDRYPDTRVFESWYARLKAELAARFLVIEFCHRCGRRVRQVWWADDTLWQELRGDDQGPWCTPCFDAEARRRGILLQWVPRILPRDPAGRTEGPPIEPTVVGMHGTDQQPRPLWRLAPAGQSATTDVGPGCSGR